VRPVKVAAGQNEVTVKTTVKDAGRQIIPVDYRLEKSGEAWKVTDVVVENLSLVTNYRSSFASEVSRSGIDGLIKALEEKNRTVAKGLGRAAVQFLPQRGTAMSTQQTRRAPTECALLKAESAASETNDERNSNRLTEHDRKTILQYFEGRWPRAVIVRGEPRPAQMRSRWIIGARLPAHARTSALPKHLEDRLSPLEPKFERLVVGSEILCVEVDSLRIVDVMRNAATSAPSSGTAQLLLDSSTSQAVPS
jgi:hypothetical protein